MELRGEIRKFQFWWAFLHVVTGCDGIIDTSGSFSNRNSEHFIHLCGPSLVESAVVVNCGQTNMDYSILLQKPQKKVKDKLIHGPLA